MQTLRWTLIAVLALTAGLDFTLAVAAWRRRRREGAKAFAGLMIAAGVYSLGYAAELNSDTLPAMLFWSRFQYFGAAPLAALWCLTSLRYAGRGQWLAGPILLLYFLLPAATALFHALPGLDILVYATAGLAPDSPFPLLAFTPGPLYYANGIYTNLLILGSVLLLADMRHRAAPAFRQQLSVMLLGSLFPWVCYVAYLLRLFPPHIDPNPFVMSISGPIFTWGLVRGLLFDLAPVARRVVFERMREPVLVFDEQGRLVDCNEAAEAAFSARIGVGAAGGNALPDLPDFLARLTDPCHPDAEFYCEDKRGRCWQVTASCIADPLKGRNRGRLAVLREVTELRRAEEALRQSEAMYRQIVERSNSLILRWTRDGAIRFVNEYATRFFGYTRDELLGTPVTDKIILLPATPEDAAKSPQALLDSILDAPLGHVAAMHEGEQRDGTRVWVSWSNSPVFDAKGRAVEILSVGADVTCRKRMDDHLRYVSTHDAMTGLFNRAYFDVELERLGQGRRFPATIMIVDLDGLKTVNDNWGHAAGDRLIKRAAIILRDSFRGEDLVARIGGDEFAALLPETSEDDAALAAQRIRKALLKANAAAGELAVSFCIGYAAAASALGLQDALRLADQRMYAEKKIRSGQGR